MKKAFTLIELVMVIVVLGLIALIAVPTVNSIINDSKEKAYNNQIKTIENTARTYMTNHPSELPKAGDVKCITTEKLKQEGLLSKEKIQNPKSNEELNGAVKITWNKNKYIYEYKDNKTC